MIKEKSRHELALKSTRHQEEISKILDFFLRLKVRQNGGVSPNSQVWSIEVDLGHVEKDQ